MKDRIYEVIYADHPVCYSFMDPLTRFYFRDYLNPAETAQYYDIKVTPEQIEEGRQYLPEDSKISYIEYRLLIQLTSRFLLIYHCCIFHCVSFVYRGYAWLLTAPSGTGKTTQYFNWQRLFPEEIKMISGDMPVLELRDDHKIYVHPTSWNGKENIGNKIYAPLGGIIVLKQGDENQISSLCAKDGIIPVFKQMIVLPETKDEILAMTDIMDCMFRYYPMMQYINLGNDKSTKLLRETINQIMRERYEV